MVDVFRFPNFIHTLQVTGCHFGLEAPGWDYPRHHHHLFELLYCSEGAVLQEIHRDAITMRAGDWLLIKSGIRHRSTNTGTVPYGFFNVHFDLDDADIRSLLAAAPYRHIPREQAEMSKLSSYVSELEAVMRRNSSTESLQLRFEDRLLLQSYILLIVHDVLHLLREQKHVTPQRDASLFATDVAHAIEEKLALGIGEEASIAGIAKEMNLSRSQCSKLFTKVYGLSPRQYVSQQTLKLAKELLVTTHLPMTAIAEKLGFQSPSHFSRQFRRWTGQSPSEFRPKHHATE